MKMNFNKYMFIFKHFKSLKETKKSFKKKNAELQDGEETPVLRYMCRWSVRCSSSLLLLSVPPPALEGNSGGGRRCGSQTNTGGAAAVLSFGSPLLSPLCCSRCRCSGVGGSRNSADGSWMRGDPERSGGAALWRAGVHLHWGWFKKKKEKRWVSSNIQKTKMYL